MKTVENKVPVLQFGATEYEDTDFRIVQNAHMFDILSSKIYRDKIGAIVRELACNAKDANKSVGKGDVPIEIGVPSASKPEIYFKDEGPGLSVEDMQMIYTTYGMSTKTDSNDFIGQLGLGSKSPFAYTQSFNIESNHNGQKHLFVAQIGANGIPKLVSYSKSIPTTDTGLRVTVPVAYGDVSSFTTAIVKQLRWFDPQPKFVGSVYMQLPRRILETEHFDVIDGAESYVLMGDVAYKIDWNFLSTFGITRKSHLRESIVLKVNIGDVDIAPSREDLNWTNRTKKKISELVDIFTKVIGVEYQKKIDQQTDYYSAVLYAYESLGSAYKDFSYKGKKLNLPIVSAYSVSSWRQRTTVSTWSSNVTLTKDIRLIYVPEGETRFTAKINYYRETNGRDNIYIIRNKKEVDKIVAEYPGFTYIDFASLPKRPPTPRNPNAKPVVKRPKIATYGWDGADWQAFKGTLINPQPYVFVSRKVIQCKDIGHYYLSSNENTDFLDFLRGIHGVDVVGVRSHSLKKIEKDPDFILLKDFLQQELVKQDIIERYSIQCVSNPYFANIVLKIKDFPGISANSEFSKILKTVPIFVQETRVQSFYWVRDVLKHFSVQTNPKYDQALDELDKKYPMIKDAWRVLHGDIREELVYYINAK